jgi:hypothetical protein
MSSDEAEDLFKNMGQEGTFIIRVYDKLAFVDIHDDV